MKLKIREKLFLLAATSTLTLSGCGLNSEYVEAEPVIFEKINVEPEDNSSNDSTMNYYEYLEKTLPEIEEEEEIPKIESEGEYVKATTNVNVRSEADQNSDRINILGLGASAKVIGEDGEFYKIEYLDQVGYVAKEYVNSYNREHVNLDPIDAVYFPNDTLLYDEEMEEKTVVPAGEFSFAYEEDGDKLLVDADGIAGYVYKSDVTHIDDDNNYVVVDISDQEVMVFNGKDILLDGPCITGGPGNETQTGLFDIWEDRGMRHLICANYPWVNVMKKFDHGRGLHDAEVWVELDGRKHGWRMRMEYGGTTYLFNGSHGCVNMTHDDAMELDNLVTVGSKVLVKR